jgi:hypothetical protein
MKSHPGRDNYQVTPAEFTDSIKISEAQSYYQADGRDSQKNSPLVVNRVTCRQRSLRSAHLGIQKRAIALGGDKSSNLLIGEFSE